LTLTPALSLREREIFPSTGVFQTAVVSTAGRDFQTAVASPADWRPPLLEEQSLLPVGEG